MKPLRTLIVLCTAVATGAAPGAAQSLFSTRGLGVPLRPLDARAQMLGGIGVGLIGLNASLVNPAAISGVLGRGAAVGMQPSARSFELAGERDEVGGTRFPLLHIMTPIGSRLTASLGYGGVLDQSWSIVSEGSETIGGQSIGTRDVIESVGGVSQVRLSLAYQAGASVAVGAAAGALTGSLDRTVTRTFLDPILPDSVQLGSFRSRASHEFSGGLAAFGIRWDPVDAVRLAGTVAWAGELHADGVEGAATDHRFDLPLQAAVGASVVLAPRVLAVVGGEWAGWESAESAFEADDAVGDSWSVGGGLEWGGPRRGGRTLPLRVGAHYGRLPFKMQGAAPTEWSVAVGAGLNVAGDPNRPVAVFDAGIERGARGDAELTGLAEDFWRITFSMALFGL